MLHKSGCRHACGRHRFLREADFRVGRLQPEVKVNMAIDMTDAVVGMCMEGIKAQNPNMNEDELMKKLRERLEWSKRWQKRGGHVK